MTYFHNYIIQRVEIYMYIKILFVLLLYVLISRVGMQA